MACRKKMHSVHLVQYQRGSGGLCVAFFSFTSGCREFYVCGLCITQLCPLHPVPYIHLRAKMPMTQESECAQAGVCRWEGCSNNLLVLCKISISDSMCRSHHHSAGFREVILVEDEPHRERKTVGTFPR